MKEIISALSKSMAIDILLLLSKNGELRYSEVKQLGHYTTVSRRLKELEKIGIVDRNVKAEYPAKVSYKLTEKGKKLLKLVEEIERLHGFWFPLFLSN